LRQISYGLATTKLRQISYELATTELQQISYELARNFKTFSLQLERK